MASGECAQQKRHLTMLASFLRRAARASVASSISSRAPSAFVAHFSSGSHDDFSPKKKTVDGEDEALALIKEHVESNRVMLYMKGNPSMVRMSVHS